MALVDVNALVEQVVSGLGYELVELETVTSRSRAGKLLRVFIDTKADGKKRSEINVDDCTSVSNQLTAVFAVENIDYDRLEISSPGVDRPLRKASDFERFAGEEATIKFRLPPLGGIQKNFAGVIELKAGILSLLSEGKDVPLELANVDRARLVPKLDFGGRDAFREPRKPRAPRPEKLPKK